MRRIAKFFALPAGDQWMLIEAAATVVVIRTALWVVPFRFLRPGLERRAATKDDAADSRQVTQVTWAVAKVSRLVPAASCLTQAMSVRRLLRRRGIGCTLRLGVKRDAGGAFEAHAWVEHAGQVVIGDQGSLAEFAPLPAL